MIDVEVTPAREQFLLSLQDYVTSTTEPVGFVVTLDDLVMIRNVIDRAIERAHDNN